MRSYCHGCYANTNSSTNEANGGASGGAAEEADPRAGLAEVAMELVIEPGKAVAHVTEVLGVWTGEGIVKAVKFYEDVKCPIALRLGEGVGVRI